MRAAINHLVDTAPPWFTVEKAGHDFLVGRARLPKTPWVKAGLTLRIEGNPTPRVREEVPGTDLPARCPERHIQGDQTFCLGLRPLAVQSDDLARQWWRQLEQYLRCQGVAELTRVWPPGQALDHGDAGEHHERALELAAQVGVEEEYSSARLGGQSWIIDPALKLFDLKGQPINGRAPCPRGCKHRARGRFVPKLRKDCSRRETLVSLALAELQRRKALDDYWQQVYGCGEKCCRTMRGCRLAAHEDSKLGVREKSPS